MFLNLLAMITCCPFLHLFKRKEKQQPGRQPEEPPPTQPAPMEPPPSVENRISSVEFQTPRNSLRPGSPASSEGEFFDARSHFSNTMLSSGGLISRENSFAEDVEPAPRPWHQASVWEFFGWGTARNRQKKSTLCQQSLEEQEGQEDRQQQEIHESDSLDRDEQARSSSTTTVDAGQSRVLTVFSNLMHHQKGSFSRHHRTIGQTLQSGTTFERREEGCTFEEAQEKWEPADATMYRVRSKNYIKTRIKEECKGAFYEVIESDLISFDKKQTHVAQMINLPVDPYKRSPEEREAIAEYGLPTLLIVNMQLPVYQPSLFGACDGPGHSFVFYCVLRQHFNPRAFQNQAALGLFQRFIRECRNQTQYRIKLIPKFLNVDEWAQKGPLTATEHRLVHQFNEKPILTRPYQHFYHESNYFEIDVDVHSWLYVARKAFWTLLPRMHEVITEVAMLIQGNRPEDLPEHLIAVARVYRVNLTQFRYLSDFFDHPIKKEEQTEDAHDVQSVDKIGQEPATLTEQARAC